MLQQRYGQQQYVQQYGRQFSQQQQTLQQRGYEQNALDNKRTSYQAGFINTPLITTNTSSAATMRLRLISYTNPTLSLPDGRTCVCPTGKSCPYLQQGIPSCMFSFTVIISAPDQSVQYISSEFMPVTGSTINTGNWTALHTLNFTSKPMAIDVFVHHLGVVIDGATAQLEFYNYVIHVDTFVVSLANYDASFGVSVSTTARGLLQGTTLQLEYRVQCTGGTQGPSCDLVCTPSSTDPNSARCVSTTTGLISSCQYSGTQVVNCNSCVNGINPTWTECLEQPIYMETRVGVSSAYRVWTIVLGCLLGVAVIFVIMLVIFYTIARNRQLAAEKQQSSRTPYSTGVFTAPTLRPLIQKDDEWNREETRATNNLRSPPTDNETLSDESFSRSNGGAVSRREAQV
uniref:Transmembrane protein n=1 Tax=Ascaris lumbricoides TaxID=6252 RepID=A0A0M3I9Y0_ASCLU